MKNKSRRYRSKSEIFANAFGGNWKYNGICSWYCDDNVRHISRCSAGVDEYDNPVGQPQYWLYGDGAPKWIDILLLSFV